MISTAVPTPQAPNSAAAGSGSARPHGRLDGRATRWDAHRVQRRTELTQAALRAIRRHGPGIGMEEVASEAGTSRTVLYRHLGDRAGVWRAVIESVDSLVLSDLRCASTRAGADTDPRAVIAALTDSYLVLVERDPDIYRFVMTRPLTDTAPDDPVAGMTSRMGETVSDVMARLIAHANPEVAHRDPQVARTLGHGLVGMVRAICDDWLGRSPRPLREDLVQEVSELFGARLDALANNPRRDT